VLFKKMMMMLLMMMMMMMKQRQKLSKASVCSAFDILNIGMFTQLQVADNTRQQHYLRGRYRCYEDISILAV